MKPNFGHPDLGTKAEIFSLLFETKHLLFLFSEFPSVAEIKVLFWEIFDGKKGKIKNHN